MPRTLNYQGTLATGSTPVPDGNYSVTFRLYTVSSGGSAVWTETQSVTTRNGVFSAILGKTAALPAAFNTSYWLSLQVGADAEMSPRLEMTGVSYSMQSALSDSTRKVGNGSIGSSQLADNAVSSTKIVDGSITGTDVASSTLSAANILDAPGVSSSEGAVHQLGSGNIIYALDSVDISFPASGYAVVIASGLLGLQHTSGEATDVSICISGSRTGLAPYGANVAYVPSGAATGPYMFPFSTTNIFNLGAGTWKFYLLAEYVLGSSASTQVGQTRLTAMYFPVLRGTLSKPVGVGEALDARMAPGGSMPVNR
jgi:hypothetical protein